eukprot:CAMPEP_0172490010 /NCGR_PEP_ID=MMETSP1066-20121228/20320_1 /TAXON_ID=671091 /ORGANISM="Coscinodiscus wailesii, Strain CCMP2513" /LENGTH=347 /DNA_ID=CAMNT_0013258273 /DNA_START=55 /DNA_END=1098 /DNA_ORIENTATION=+
MSTNYYDILSPTKIIPHMKTAAALALAQSADPNVVSIISQSQVATLWAGMGSIVRLKCEDTFGNSTFIIAKNIKCSNPRSFGDKRKAASYRVEASFYGSQYCKDLSERHICCKGLYTEDDGNGSIAILMTPLPNATIRYMDGDTAQAAVRSVARLHAYFWGDTKADAAVAEGGLAEQGTYWYLDTRPDEYDYMSDRGLSGELKRAASDIDEALKNHEYQTVCHGDLKGCNMAMSRDPRYVMFVDFQYLGKACPAKDLAYLFVCGMDVDLDFEERREREMLQLYIDELAACGVGADRKTPLPTLEGLKEALDLSYCDLYRWMLGWGVWGNGFLEGRVERCLGGIVEKL